MQQGCEVFAEIKDDVLVCGTEEHHEGCLRAVLERFKEAGFTLRKDKCTILKEASLGDPFTTSRRLGPQW